jgi:HEAT repeat protein
MHFYDLTKEKRKKLVLEMKQEILDDLKRNSLKNIKKYASDKDTYIRKNTYLILGKIYHVQKNLQIKTLKVLGTLFKNNDWKIRQTAVYAFSEIGKIDASKSFKVLEQALYDKHHAVRNALVGGLKQIGEKNPKPILKFAKRFLHNPDPEIRLIIVHGIELRGRDHPEDILPLLSELQNDPDKKVQKKIIHVLSQISYKKGCLEKVITDLKKWSNQELVCKAINKILDVHLRYENFSAKSYQEAKIYIENNIRK